MSAPHIGIWLIGARGGVATSTSLGLAALQKQLAEETGLVSALPEFSHLGLPRWKDFVIGGHEIRDVTMFDEALRLNRESRVFDAETLIACQDDLNQIETRIRPGVLCNVGPTIRSLAPQDAEDKLGPAAAVERIQADLRTFQTQNELENVIVINLASTEAPVEESRWPKSWDQTQAMLHQDDCPLPASSLYAIAALDLGMTYINFTPSLGATPEGIGELARERKTRHAGRDAKTGETLLKSVLAPMFAARNLDVLSWVGHNIFGNLDGKVLDDPSNKASKVKSKDHLLENILGYAPQTLVSIEHIESLADWKTAWDHIHFRGFLNTPMMLQFTWQGCDSLLAAPLVLDLARFAQVAYDRKEIGCMSFLSSFFKSPLGTENQVFSDQTRDLEAWAKRSV